MKQHKWHKECKECEALKKCLRVLEPIKYVRIYESQWVDSAIEACKEALEQPTQEWQGLDLEQQRSLYHKIMAEIPKVNISWWDFKTIYPTIEQKLKEKNHGTT